MANTRGFGRLGKAWVQESAQKNRHLVESLVDVSQPRDIDSVRGRFGALLPEAETGAETRAGCLYPSRPHVVPSGPQSRALVTLANVHELPVPQCLEIDFVHNEHSKWKNSLVQNERGELACLRDDSRNLGTYYRRGC
jgi:hypothetical protein